jgi:serine protease AprX
MHESSERGRARGERSSALWGTGGRGGEGRSSALWGKGGRGFVVTAVAVLALGAPLAATAAPGQGKGPSPSNPSGTYVAPDLTSKAKDHPNDLVRVIIRSTYGTSDAVKKAKGLGPLMRLGRNLNLIGGVAVSLPARLVDKLSLLPGLSVTPDAPARIDSIGPSYYSQQMWPYDNGNAFLWGQGVTPATIAVVDSGIDQTRADFSNGARVLASVNLSTLDPNPSMPDDRGHGTFVAGIAAGSAPGYAGASPRANLVSIKVMDANGMAYTSDVIAACDWILQHKDQYNIKVANFSLHSNYPSNFGHDPLDAAVEKLWFDGVTVVAAAGNYGNADGSASGVRYAPGNDPFVITVGAVDLGTSIRLGDDSIAYWSAWGRTYDGFWKPDISAVGRYMIGPVPPNATLPQERPDHVKAPGYMELSGTSFAAPVVAGTAAQLMARHPGWGPDQVKGALMHSANPIPQAQPFQGGVGQINAIRANMVTSPGNPNKALEQFVVPDPAGGSIPVFDAVSWYDAAMNDVSWDSVSWADVSWSDVSWDSVSWDSVSWDSVSWADVSWSDVSWADVSWADSSKEDAVEGDSTPGEAQPMDSTEASELLSDPSLTADPTLDYSVLGLFLSGSTSSTDTSSTSTDTSSTATTTTP